MTKPKGYLTKKDAQERLKAEGLPYDYDNFFLKYEKTGQLKVRRNPFNGYRVFTEAEIEELVKAVKEGGKNFTWYAKESEQHE